MFKAKYDHLSHFLNFKQSVIYIPRRKSSLVLEGSQKCELSDAGLKNFLRYPCQEYSLEINKELNYTENALQPRIDLDKHLLALG